MVYLLSYEHEETVKHLMEVRAFSKLIAGRIMSNTGIHKKKILEYSKITPLYIILLEISALLHDFGKIHKEIKPLIRLPRKLTREEYERVKKHTGYGAELIGNSNEMLRMCQLVARYHHEKWDGSGYPEGLRGNEIPLSARIVAFADMFSALRDERAYKKAITDEGEIIRIFYQCEKHFDPVVFQAGIELIPEMLELTLKIDLRYRDLKMTSDSFIQFLRGVVNS
jgi:putative two-component system response regulator